MCVYLWAEETTFGAHDPAGGGITSARSTVIVAEVVVSVVS